MRFLRYVSKGALGLGGSYCTVCTFRKVSHSHGFWLRDSAQGAQCTTRNTYPKYTLNFVTHFIHSNPTHKTCTEFVPLKPNPVLDIRIAHCVQTSCVGFAVAKVVRTVHE